MAKELHHPRSLIEKGYVLADAATISTVSRCSEVDVVLDAWVPGWALELNVRLEAAGYSREQRADLFSHGRSAAEAELVSVALRKRG